MHSAPAIQRVTIIGFGEVGGIFGSDFARQGMTVRVFDILLGSRKHRATMLEKARKASVEAVNTLSECLRDAELVISAVTASSSLAVAKQSGRMLRRGQIFLDINSVSPETKRRARAMSSRAGRILSKRR
jgi:3-hydroxyisobutyrate dehydrogenase-like beta-hydroxyacid dehydrogenase